MFINAIIVIEWVLTIVVGCTIMHIKEKKEDKKEKKDRWLV